MTDSKPVLLQWFTGQAPPPVWVRLPGTFALAAMVVGLAVKRGAAVGFIAAVFYGSIAMVTLLAWQRTVAWSKRHPVLDSLGIVPLLFLFIAYITNLSIGACVLIALPTGLFLVALSALLRRRRATRV